MSRPIVPSRIATLLPALVLAAAACTDGTGPVLSAGDYVLERVNDRPLPYTWTYPETSSSYTIRYQRITIGAGGVWTSSTSHVLVYPTLTRDETNHLDGGTFTFDDGSGALTLGSSKTMAVLVGTASGRRITITKDGDRLVYER